MAAEAVVRGKKKISNAVTVIIVILIIVFAALIAGTLLPRKTPEAAAENGQRPDGQARAASAVRVRAVESGTIENSVVLNGDVLPRAEISVFPSMAGRLTEMRRVVGDRVRRGDVIAILDPSRPGEAFALHPVTASVTGTVLKVNYAVGDTVSSSSALYVVGDLSALVVETFVPERFVNAARKGLTAQVKLEALPAEVFPAVVDEVSPVLDPASRTLRIRLRFARADPRIKAGMFSTVTLVTETVSGVPVIPRAALINTYGSWIVFVMDTEGAAGIARRREVITGLESEDLVEITDGLKEGEKVVVDGQNFLTDGDPIRVVE